MVNCFQFETGILPSFHLGEKKKSQIISVDDPVPNQNEISKLETRGKILQLMISTDVSVADP